MTRRRADTLIDRIFPSAICVQTVLGDRSRIAAASATDLARLPGGGAGCLAMSEPHCKLKNIRAVSRCDPHSQDEIDARPSQSHYKNKKATTGGRPEAQTTRRG